MDDQFVFSYDEGTKLFHAEIKGVPFTFSKQELEELDFLISTSLLDLEISDEL